VEPAFAIDTLFNTDYPIDIISGYLTGSVTVASGDFIDTSVPHGLGYKPLYMFKWSTTSTFTVSYDQIGVSTVNGIQVFAVTKDTDLFILLGNTTASSVTIYYRCIFFMPTTIDVFASSTQAGLDDYILNTDYNYTKVYDQGFINSATGVVTHDLGYFPQVEAWYISSPDGECVRLVESSVATTAYPNITITTSSITFANGTTTTASAWHYKIYLDEV
jgi:hypothetical protein